MHRALPTLFCLLALNAAQPALAQAPAITQPLRLIVPNAPGGPTDTVARLVGQKLAERLGVAVVIDNRPGASGTIGGEIVARSAPDGRTLLLTSSSAFTAAPILLPHTAYDGRRDFAQVTAIVSVRYLLLLTVTHGICVTAKTPPSLVTHLNREVVAATQAPEIRERLAALGAEVVASTPEEYRSSTQAEVRRWEKVVREVAAKGR